jgi:hypothetical protein
MICPKCNRECLHLEDGKHIYNDKEACCICQKTNNAFIICMNCSPLIDWDYFRRGRKFRLKSDVR